MLKSETDSSLAFVFPLLFSYGWCRYNEYTQANGVSIPQPCRKLINNECEQNQLFMLLDLVSVASSDLVPSVNEFGDDDLLEDLISIISDDDNMLTIECYRHLASDDDIPLTKIYHLDPPDLIFLPSESDSSCGPSPLSLTEAGCPIPEASFSDDIALLQLVSRAPTVPIVTACKLTSWRDVHWTDEHEVIVRKIGRASCRERV